MSERTPKTNKVRWCFAKGHDFPETTDHDERYAEFDRWLAQHDEDVAQKAVNRFYELLIYKGEYQDIYGLAYVGDIVQKELRGEIQIVIDGAQLCEVPLIKGESE